MKILFKSNDRIFFIEDDELVNEWIPNVDLPNVDLPNVPHIDEVEVLYHYKDKRGNMYPVYYEHSDRFITKGERYYINMSDNLTKDYTLVNFKFLDNI